MSELAAKPSESSRRFNWRRLFQFRLRTILIVTTIIAVALGWWSYKARQQRVAAVAVRKVGAIILYDFEHGYEGQGDGRTNPPETPPYWPAWLVNALGVDYFASVQVVILCGHTPVRDQEVLGTQIRDADLESLKGLTTVTILSLRDGLQVTDAGLEHLEGLRNLRELWLNHTNTTEAGVQRLQKALPNCKIER